MGECHSDIDYCKSLQVEELRDNLDSDGFKFELRNKALVSGNGLIRMKPFKDNASNGEEIITIPETPPAISNVGEEEQDDCDGFDLGFSPIVTRSYSLIQVYGHNKGR